MTLLDLALPMTASANEDTPGIAFPTTLFEKDTAGLMPTPRPTTGTLPRRGPRSPKE